jgi:hypothetical protein
MAHLTLLVEETRLVDRCGCNKCINLAPLIAKSQELAPHAGFLKNSKVERKRKYPYQKLKLYFKKCTLLC